KSGHSNCLIKLVQNVPKPNQMWCLQNELLIARIGYIMFFILLTETFPTHCAAAFLAIFSPMFTSACARFAAESRALHSLFSLQLSSKLELSTGHCDTVSLCT